MLTVVQIVFVDTDGRGPRRAAARGPFSDRGVRTASRGIPQPIPQARLPLKKSASLRAAELDGLRWTSSMAQADVAGSVEGGRGFARRCSCTAVSFRPCRLVACPHGTTVLRTVPRRFFRAFCAFTNPCGATAVPRGGLLVPPGLRFRRRRAACLIRRRIMAGGAVAFAQRRWRRMAWVGLVGTPAARRSGSRPRSGSQRRPGPRQWAAPAAVRRRQPRAARRSLRRR